MGIKAGAVGLGIIRGGGAHLFSCLPSNSMYWAEPNAYLHLGAGCGMCATPLQRLLAGCWGHPAVHAHGRTRVRRCSTKTSPEAQAQVQHRRRRRGACLSLFSLPPLSHRRWLIRGA